MTILPYIFVIRRGVTKVTKNHPVEVTLAILTCSLSRKLYYDSDMSELLSSIVNCILYTSFYTHSILPGFFESILEVYEMET